MIARKPLGEPIESRESGKPHSIRYTDSQWEAFFEAAKARRIGVTEYVRLASIAGHSYLAAQAAIQKHSRAQA